MHVAVVGAGIVGLATCHRLAHLGAQITLIERGDSYGAGVSSIALGGITPFSDDFIADKMGSSSQQILKDFQSLVASLRCDENTLSYYDTGVIYIAFDLIELERLTGEFSDLFPEQIKPKLLSKSEVLELFSDVNPEIVGGVLVDCEPSIDPSLLMRQLFSELSERVNFKALFKADVLHVSDEGSVKYKKGGVVKEHHFDFVVVCTGADNQALKEKKFTMRGVKGQAALCALPSGAKHGLSHHVYAHMPNKDGFDVSAYIVPRSDSTVIVGVTYEESFISSANDIKGLSAVFDAVKTMLPLVKHWEVVELKSGIRPVSQDMGPIIGWKAENSKVLVSLGHYGLGVTLAPFSANIIANLLGLSAKKPNGSIVFSPSRLK